MRHAALLSATLLLALPLCAQTTAAGDPSAPAPDATVLRTGTQLVIVDVVVQDKDGHPVHGLKSSNFKLTEDKNPANIQSFDEHTPLPANVHGPEIPKLPAGTFTNYTPTPPNGALNILLLDALNTPMKDQSFVRNQLQQYAKHAPPGARIAIFGLTNRLLLLQGFTSDPEILKSAVDHKLIPRASTLLDDPAGTGNDVESMSDTMADSGIDASIVANVAQFEAEQAAIQTQFRIQYTLDAFNNLAHYLANFPGRKNLIWFSGSFPINILPDPSLANPFGVSQMNEEEFRETMNLLTRAEVSVYPVDARGLMTAPMFEASNPGRGYARNPSKFGTDLTKFNSSQAQEHTTMQQMADDTGGHAFYNTNGLADAVAKAIDAGSNYYTLTYAPSNRKYDGSYRNIRVTLVDTPPNLQLSYRHGYYADDPNHLKKNEVAASTPAAELATGTSTATPGQPPNPRTAAYARAAISRGAPAPQDILLKVRILPASTATESSVAADNQLDPKDPLKGPFQRLDLDFVSLPSELTLTSQPDGNRTASVEFFAYLYDADGKLLNATGRTVKLNLTPENYPKFLKAALNAHLELSAPLKRDTYVRLGIHDLNSNRFGVVEIPTSTVSRLPPPVYPAAPPAAAPPAAAPPAPSSTPSTPAPASPATSTPAPTTAAPPAATPTTPHL